MAIKCTTRSFRVLAKQSTQELSPTKGNEMLQTHRRLSNAFVVTVVLILSCATVAHSQDDKKEKKEKKLPQGTTVLWREPSNIGSRDLLLGPGGEAMKPDLSRITFVKEEKGGYSKKYRIKDGRGRVWVAKLGKEAQSETAAVRLVWATGYTSEINYLVPRLTLEGKGTLENVRLEAKI